VTDKQTMNVLVVDDEKDIREGCERILKRMDFNVLMAEKGEDALNIVNSEPVEITLLDLKMPGIDGMEVLRKIREKNEEILVIVITGFATVEAAIEAMKQGAYDFIPKPFEPAQLRIVVGRAREKIRLQQEAEKLEAERRRTLADLGTEKSRIRTIIESLPNGVLVTNTLGQVVLMNPACFHHLNLPEDYGTGDMIKTYIADNELCDLVMNISSGKYNSDDDIPTYEFAMSDKKFLMARGRPVLNKKNECLGAVINFMDITAIKLLDRLKSEFVAKVSHELRSPLSTIHEQLAVVLRDVAEEESIKDHEILSRAKEKTQNLIALIGDMLDLSRIEAGNVGCETKQIRLEELLKSIVEFMQDKIQSRNQSLKLNQPDTDLPYVAADPMALESIFGNLITNAINYTPDGGDITVTIESTDKGVRTTVSDTGFGIEEKYLEKIFERFYRVKDDNTRYITGTGLGLPIVKELVERLNGNIKVKSQKGKGTTFTVFLPAKNN